MCGSSRGQGLLGLLLFTVGLLLVSWWLGKMVATATSWPWLVAVIAGVIVVLVTFINPDAGFIVLIFSMLLSPELQVAGTPQRGVVIRVDDILLFLVFIVWWARLALRRELGILRRTPLNTPLILFLVVCVVSTAISAVGGHISGQASFFYILKYAEYFLTFFMFASQLRTTTQLRWYVGALLLTAFIIGCCGYAQLGRVERISAPFEGEHSEPNTLAGYLVLVMAVCGGLALRLRVQWQRLLMVGLWVFLIPPFVMTLSRGGYVAFGVSYLVLLWLASARQRLVLGGILMLALLAGPVLLPQSVIHRVTDTFASDGTAAFGGRIKLDISASQRVEAWPFILNALKERPLLGYGVTGIGLVDQQYLLVLGEVGIIGLAIYLWSRWLLWVHGLRILRQTTDHLGQGLAVGLLAGFAGLLIHSFAANIFIIVRIMGPFWCLAAMVMVLPELTTPAQPVSARGTAPASGF